MTSVASAAAFLLSTLAFGRPRTVIGLQFPSACTTKARPSYNNTLWSHAEKPFENTSECRCAGRGFSASFSRREKTLTRSIWTHRSVCTYVPMSEEFLDSADVIPG